MSIELRLSDIPPPEPEPTRTIYRDIVNLPDPMLLGLTIRAFNYDDVGLYFQITGSHPEYTFQTVNLGYIGSGANIYRNLDEFASRAKPAVETVEAITLILKAYEDSGYTQLKHTYERSVMVVIINSADGTWTQDVLNDFDDGTLQGWAGINEVEDSTISLTVAEDYVLSAPYSLKAKLDTTYGGAVPNRCRIYKSFTTPDKTDVYAVIDVRAAPYSDVGAHRAWLKKLYVRRDGTVLTAIGKIDYIEAHSFPKNKWMRIVVPLPRNTTVEIQIALHWYAASGYWHVFMWLDDFRIISRD